jgi:hypothetical protein
VGGKKILLVVLFVFPTVVLGQSLGEVAKKEKKRREKNQQEGVKVRVVGESEVSTEESEETSAEVGTLESELPPSVDPPANDPSKSSSVTDRQREEAEWRRRIGDARARVKAAEERYNFLSGLHLVQGEYYVDENGKPVITSLAQLRRMINEAKVELDSARAAMEKLREDARRAGVPPGWFR